MPETMPFGMAHVAGVFSQGEVVIKRRLLDLQSAHRYANELAAEEDALHDELTVLLTELAIKTQRKTDISKRLETLKAKRNELLGQVENVLFPRSESAAVLALQFAQSRLRAAESPSVTGYTG